MGGLTFGPFNGIVQLGSDARRCQIVLDSSQGVFPVHATLAPAGGGAFHFSPADMQAKCFVIQTGSPQVWPVNAAVQVNLGDALVVGTPAGPRFHLVDASSHVAPRAAGGGLLDSLGAMVGAPKRRNQPSLADGLSNEVQRRAQASLMRNSTFRELTYLHRRFKTGQLFSPVNIIGALVTLGGMVFAGGLSCSGLLLAAWHRFTF